MKMSKPVALLWLVLTVLPVTYVVVSTSSFTHGIEVNLQEDEAQAQETADRYTELFLRRLIIAYFCMLILVTSYVVYLVRMKGVSKGKKALWIILLISLNNVVMPFFWYFYVWRPLNRANKVDSDST